MADTKVTKGPATKEEPKPEESKASEQMCCDGHRTAADHRKESDNGKCCSD